MYNFKHIFKRTLEPIIKYGIIAGCFYFIYTKLFLNQDLSWAQFSIGLRQLSTQSLWGLLLVILLSVCNWLLEILKWQTLVNAKLQLRFKMAAKQCLSALTVSLLTPNRIGDYVAKAMYFPKDKAKMIVGLNAVGQFSQLLMTLLFGLFGLVYLSKYFNLGFLFNFNLFWISASVIWILFLSKKGRSYSHRVKRFYKSVSQATHLKILIISLLRYLIFSHQFYVLTLLFGLPLDYETTMMAIFSMYILASVVPSIAVLDWAVKGSAAVFVFGLLHVNTILILEISVLMWLLNFALPALIGSVFVLRFKSVSLAIKSELI